MSTFICPCLYVYVYMSTFICTCLYVHVYMSMFICLRLYVHVYMSMFICLCLYVYVYMSMFICLWSARPTHWSFLFDETGRSVTLCPVNTETPISLSISADNHKRGEGPGGLPGSEAIVNKSIQVYYGKQCLWTTAGTCPPLLFLLFSRQFFL